MSWLPKVREREYGHGLRPRTCAELDTARPDPWFRYLGFRWLVLPSRRNVSANPGETSRAPRVSYAASAQPFAAENWSDESRGRQCLRTESGREPAVRQPARR